MKTMSKTFDQFVKDYEGKTVGYPDNNSFLGECLSLTKWHIKEVYGINPPASGCNGARCYWSVFPNPLGTVLKKVAYTPGLIPKRGWIAVWNEKTGGGFGHIGSVLEANAGSFVSLDQNWNGRHAHRVTHNFANVYGFLIPLKEESMATELEACLADRKKFWEERDAEIVAHKQTKVELEQAKKDRDRYRDERNKARTELEDMAIELSKSQENVHRLTTELETCLAGGSIVTDPPTIPGWKVNGLQVRVGDKTYNYAEE